MKTIHGTRSSLLLALGLSAGLLSLFSPSAKAAAYTFTVPGVSGQTITWSSGTDWSPGAPVSGSTTELDFNSPGRTFANYSENDITGVFQAQIIDLEGTGSSNSGQNSVLNIEPLGAGNTLELVGGSTVNMDANYGVSTLKFNVSIPIALDGATTFQGNGSSLFTFSGNITNNTGDTGSILKTGTSTLDLTAANNAYSGGTTIQEGTVIAQYSNGLGSSSGAVTLGNTASDSNAASLYVGDSGSTSGSHSILANNITVAAGTTGTLTIGSLYGLANAIFSGNITLDNNLTVTQAVASNAGIVVLGNYSSSTYSSNGHTISAGTAGTKTLTFAGATGGTIAVYNAITDGSGQINVVQNGSEAATLYGTNTYSGSTVISAGSLTLSGTGSIANTSGISVTGGTLVSSSSTANALGTNNTIAITSATLTLNVATSISSTSNLTFTSGSTGNLAFTGFDTIANLSLDGGATYLAIGDYTASMLNGMDGVTFTGSGGFDVLDTGAVPEPSTYALLLCGTIILFLGRRRLIA